MPLKIKLPLDGKKQTLTCQNCPFTTKKKNLFEEHGKGCTGGVEKVQKSKGEVSNGEGEDIGKVTNGKCEENLSNNVEESELSVDDNSSVNGDDSVDHKVVVRHYTCKICGFQTTNSKGFLFHQRDEHQADFDIFPCDICDYASKWKCKVIRHREMIHKGAPHMAMQDYAKLKSPHRVSGKPGPKYDGSKPRKTPLSMVPTPEMVPLPKITDLDAQDGFGANMPLTQLNGANLFGGKKKKASKRKLNQEETVQVKKRVTDGRSQPRSNFLQFMELCSAEGQEPRYRCKLCFYSNLRKWQIRQHIKARHVNAKSFTCPIGKCTFSTYKKAEFFAHKTKHNQVTFQCEECEYVTFLKPNLDRHKLNHGMAGVPFKCSLCSYASAKEAAVMRHVQEHHLAKEKQVVKVNGDSVPTSLTPPPPKKPKKKRATLPTMVGDDALKRTSPPQMTQTTLDTFYAQIRDTVDGQSTVSSGSYDVDRANDQYVESPSLGSDYNDDGREEAVQKEDLSDVIGDTAFMCPECGFTVNSVAKLDKHMMTHGYDIEGNEVEPSENVEKPESSHVKLELETGDQDGMEPLPDVRDEPNGLYHDDYTYENMKSEYVEQNGDSGDQGSVDCPSAEQNALFSTNGDVVCNICGYVAVTLTRLKGHMVSHSNDFKYPCDLCPRKYKRSSDLNYHMKKAHNIRLRDYLQGTKEQEEPLNLSMRSNTSNGSGSVDQDMPEPMDFIEDGPLPEENGGEQPLDLSHAGVMEPEEEELHGVDMQCTQCPYIAKWPSDMRRHQLVHTGDRRYKCHLCSRTYKWQGDLNVHLKKGHDQVEKTVSPVQPLVPPLKAFHTPNKPRKGVAGEYPCKYCDYVAKYTSELMRHTRIHTNEKPYKCSFCQYHTAWKGDLKRHIEKHHADQLQDEKAIYTILQEIEREVNETYCSEYNMLESDATSVVSDDSEPLASSTPQKMELFMNRADNPSPFRQPKDSENARDGNDPCLCKICGWRAPMPSKLDMHLVAHDNIKVYKCTICGFRTNWVWDTRKHVRAKHGIDEPGPYCLKMNELEARATIAAYLETTRERPGRVMGNHNNINNNNIEKEKPPKTVMKPAIEVPIKSENAVPVSGPGSKGGPAHHGYARPFKCSACPRRSNWKWELKKHIKLVHEGTAQIIILSREEALATLPPGLTPGMKLNIGDNAKSSEKPKPTILKTPSAASVSALFQHSPSSKEKEKAPPATPSPAKSNLSFRTSPSPSVASKGSNQVDHDKTKKFKCSSCPYRSNYRSDVQRHVYNKHRKVGEVITLDKETALKSLQEYLNTFPGKKFMGRSRRMNLEKQIAGLGTKGGGKDQKEWKCNKCDFSHTNRDAIYEHLLQHYPQKVQLYSCKLCPYSSELWSAVKRHIRNVHEQPEEGNWVLNEVEGVSGISGNDDQSGEGKYQVDGNENAEQPPGEGFVEKRFRCKQCGARSNWKNAMYRHIREVHSLTSYNLIEELTQGPEGLISIPHVPRGEGSHSRSPSQTRGTESGGDVSENGGDLVMDLENGDDQSFDEKNDFNPPRASQNGLNYGNRGVMDLSGGSDDVLSDGSFSSGQAGFSSEEGSNENQDEDQNDWDKEPVDSNGGKKASGGKQSGANHGGSESSGGQGGACGGPHDGGRGHGGAGGGQDGDGKKPRGDSKKDKKKKKKKKLEKRKVSKKKKLKAGMTGSKKGTLLDFTVSKDKMGQRNKKTEQAKSELEKELLKTLKPSSSSPETKGEIQRVGKLFRCSICPYQTCKSQNVLMHQRLHVQRPGHDIKCPHCPYYVSQPRILKQHLKCHMGRNKGKTQEGTETDMSQGNDAAKSDVKTNMLFVEVIKPASSKEKEEVVHVVIEKPGKPRKPKDGGQVVGDEKMNQEQEVEVEKPVRSKKCVGEFTTFVSDFNRKIFDCPSCPYLSKSKTDMLYHKQFHRKRALVKYKCQHCDYWAIHKRVISQHEKLHDPAWRINRLAALKRLLVKDSDKKPTAMPAVAAVVQASPAKSEVSERSYADYDPVDIASIKHELIFSKITAVPVSTLPQKGAQEEELAKKLEDSPEKIPEDKPASQESGEDAVIDVETVEPPQTENVANPEEANDNVPKRRRKKIIPPKKLLRCRHCPYTNIRETNIRLHEEMHGDRDEEGLIKCPKCDFHVGNKVLLNHHLKVHAENYQPEFSEREVSEDAGDDSAEDSKPPSSDTPFVPKEDGVPFVVKYDDMREEHIIQPTLLTKYSCEKCPYGTSKRSQFEKHYLLHGSKQKFTCEFCDYSVPLNSLLVQHKKLHLMPNQNLLAVQSISNLRHLPDLPADVAVAMVGDVETAPQDPIAQYSGMHDHLELFENGMEYEEPKKLYRCDRCPYTNVRRDHLLMHLRCHMIRSDLQCPYCDYSVTKGHLLTQHIKVHFGPLAVEEEIIFNSENRQNVNQENGVDLSKKSHLGLLKPDTKAATEDSAEPMEDDQHDGPETMPVPMPREAEERPHLTDPRDENTSDEWRCRYCDREFPASAVLVKHEMQHLIGCHF